VQVDLANVTFHYLFAVKGSRGEKVGGRERKRVNFPYNVIKIKEKTVYSQKLSIFNNFSYLIRVYACSCPLLAYPCRSADFKSTMLYESNQSLYIIRSACKMSTIASVNFIGGLS